MNNPEVQRSDVDMATKISIITNSKTDAAKAVAELGSGVRALAACPAYVNDVFKANGGKPYYTTKAMLAALRKVMCPGRSDGCHDREPADYCYDCDRWMTGGELEAGLYLMAMMWPWSEVGGIHAHKAANGNALYWHPGRACLISDPQEYGIYSCHGWSEAQTGIYGPK